MGVSPFRKGMQEVPSEVQESVLEAHSVVAGCPENFYATCGSLRGARIMFDRLCEHVQIRVHQQ